MTFVPRLLLWSSFVLSGIFDSVNARPGPRPSLLNRRAANDTGRPCGALFDIIEEDLKLQFFPVFNASDVYSCLTAVPFLKDVGLRFIEYYNTTLQFQSTLAYLESPPAEYQQPAVDVVAELGRVKQKVLDDQYTRQLDFEYDIHSIVHAIHDDHVNLYIGITAAFSFASPFDFVSASLDGKALPRIYLKDDIVKARNNGWAEEPSPVATINGADVTEFLAQFSSRNAFGYLESHADWNDMFEHPTNDIQGFYGTLGGQLLFYPGNGLDDTFNVKLEDGTEWNDNWLALLNQIHSPGPLETAGDFYNYFVLGLAPPVEVIEDSSDSGLVFDFEGEDGLKLIEIKIDTDWLEESDEAFPKPEVAQPFLTISGGGVVTGYFQDDVGILSIPTFEQFPEEAKNFSNTVQEFITKAEDRNVKKIIIDLQQNRGGSPNLAFDTFRRFFPQEPDSLPWTWAGSRRRSHPLGDLVGDTITEWWKGLDTEDDVQLFDQWDEAANEFVIATKINPLTNTTYDNWAQYSPGSASYREDTFSKVERLNLSDDQVLYSAFSIETVEDDPYGYGGNPVTTKQAWKPEDIVILTDGLCSSTCSLFVGFMTQAGVRTIVAGGRPETGPMQAVSGSRGTRAYSNHILDRMFQFTGQLLPDNSSLPNIPIDYETRDTGLWVHHAGLNLRDEILKSDWEKDPNAEHVPRQFQYEAAHCRIFYTVRNIYNMTQLWSDVAKAAWTDPSLCVDDSTGYAKLPNQPAPVPAPTRPTAQDAQIVINTTTTRGGPGQDPDGVPIFNEGDIVAGFAVKRAGLEPCGAGDKCPSNSVCEPIKVVCANGERPKATEAKYCLPLCKPAMDTCAHFASDVKINGALRCDLRYEAVTKSRKHDFVGLCAPREGIKPQNLCPGRPTA
ncbi:Putative protein of unknown function [Podospora comata]|uniref:Tail specific protease domain-containing protein n=1 Tax=Podospora comata TaxID=48703 RepID=A0ABY6SHU5_PODCO|nr:Putative protein of unknown function [Podospora comata]